MGVICSNPNPIPDNLLYENLKTICIKEKNPKGDILRLTNLTISLPSPIFQSFEIFTLNNFILQVSSCIIPNLDPRGTIKKDCQDSLFYHCKANLAIFGLFDGHGREGAKVSNFCCEFIKTQFDQNFETFKSNPEESLTNIIISCDLNLKNSGIDVRLSGTTGVLLLVTSEGFHVASVGDSRAVLATVPPVGTEAEELPVSLNRFKRKIQPRRLLKTVQMSIDQKPEHEMEMKRIEECGGIVQKLTDEGGNGVGPFRVWEKAGTIPGLAMSRSIGDEIAKEIGVTAQPVYHFFPYLKFRDQFIVMGSDGIWDVIENIEAVNFIDRFHKTCIEGISPKPYPHTPSNSSISHLLAEEARYRWLGICEEEDVIVDDISAVVIKIKCLEPAPMQLPEVTVKRQPVCMNTVKIVKNLQDFGFGVGRGDGMKRRSLRGKEKTEEIVNVKRELGNEGKD